MPTSKDDARSAQDEAVAAASRHAPVVGVAIVRSGDGYGLRLNLAAPPPDPAALPQSVGGVSLRYQVTGPVQLAG